MAPLKTEPLAFAPTRRVLDFAIDELGELGASAGGAIDTAERRAAFAHFLAFGPETRAYPPGWRHDYAALGYAELEWSSGRARVATLPARRAPVAPASVLGERDDAPALAVDNAGGIVHVGSTYLEPQSPRHDPRVTLLALADAIRTRPRAVAAVHRRLLAPRDDRFVALVTAFQNCGVFVDIPSGVALEAPLQIVWTAQPGATSAIFAQTVVRVGAGARATIVERYVGERETFFAGTVEIDLGPGAELEYVVIQNADDGARIVTRRAVRCAAGARLGWSGAHLGAALASDALDVRLDGDGARTEIAAFSFARGFANVDLAIACDHRGERTASTTVVREAALDRGRGRFLGRICVAPDAVATRATMRDDALVLSRDAYLEAVPTLEVDCDDVAVGHAATVGSLDEEALFYVQARGIARGRAERMMALAFFEVAIARFPSDAIRDEVRTLLDARLDAIEGTFAQ